MMEIDSNPITKPSKKGTILSAVFYALAVVLLITAFVSLVACHQNVSRQLEQGVPVQGNELAISLLSTFRNMLLNAPIGQNLWKRKQPTEMCVMVKHSICKNPKGAFSRIGCESGTFRQTSLRSYKLLKNKSL